MARVSVGSDLHVASPPEDAYHVWNQRYLYPRFLCGVLEVEELDETWSRWRVDRDGRQYSLEVETTDNVPRRLVAWRDDGLGHPHTTVRLIGPPTGPTVVSVEVTWHPQQSGAAALTEADQRLAELEANLHGFREYLRSELGGYVDTLRSLEQLPHTD